MKEGISLQLLNLDALGSLKIWCSGKAYWAPLLKIYQWYICSWYKISIGTTPSGNGNGRGGIFSIFDCQNRIAVHLRGTDVGVLLSMLLEQSMVLVLSGDVITVEVTFWIHVLYTGCHVVLQGSRCTYTVEPA